MQYAKAILGALLAGLGATGTALTDGVITGAEWVVIGTAVVVAAGAVWGVPNATTSASDPMGFGNADGKHEA